MRWAGAVAIAAALLAAASAAARASGPATIADLDLSRPFGLPAGWRFVATQDAPVADPTGEEDRVPGPVHLCLRSPAGGCDPVLPAPLRRPAVADDIFTEPHALLRAAIVHPGGAAEAPLLLVTAGSVLSGDGDQVVVTQLFARRGDGFARVLRQETGHNNNQEVRFVDAGPLRGAVIAAEPTQDAPFGYWITVSQPSPGGPYRRVVRFRSSTRYGDGNPLAVIDSEMPDIQRRLGLWRPGRPLPAPAGCARPRLKAGALWCD